MVKITDKVKKYIGLCMAAGGVKVGFDLEAGTYNVLPYGNAGQPCVRVHKESVYDMDSFLGNFLPENGKIKVKKGDYLELDNCILEKNE